MKEFTGFSFIVLSEKGAVSRIRVDHIDGEDPIFNIAGDKEYLSEKLQHVLGIIREQLLKEKNK